MHTPKNANSSTPTVHEQQPREKPDYAHNNRSVEYAQNRHSVHRQRIRKWAILDDEFENGLQMWKNFILTETLRSLDRNFWGTVLGYACNGYLRPKHIQGWVGRMMHLRQRQQQKEGASDMRWSILPPQFYDYLDFESINHLYDYHLAITTVAKVGLQGRVLAPRGCPEAEYFLTFTRVLPTRAEYSPITSSKELFQPRNA
ncbi:hypothetical protein R6Q57_009340 [Mikania cordata]